MHNLLEKNLLFNSQTWKGTSIPYSNTKGKETSLSQTALTRFHKLYSLTFLHAGNNVIIVDFASLCILKPLACLRLERYRTWHCGDVCVRTRLWVGACVHVCVSVCVRERERETENKNETETRLKILLLLVFPWKWSSPLGYEIDEKCGWVSFMQVQRRVQSASHTGCVSSRSGHSRDHWSAHKMASSRPSSHHQTQTLTQGTIRHVSVLRVLR